MLSGNMYALEEAVSEEAEGVEKDIHTALQG
jgi:hypothetical protein